MVNFERPRPKIITPEGQRHPEPKLPQKKVEQKPVAKAPEKKVEQKPVPKPEKLKPAFVDPEPTRMMNREVERPREVPRQELPPEPNCRPTEEIQGFLDGLIARHRKKILAMSFLSIANGAYQTGKLIDRFNGLSESEVSEVERRIDEAHDKTAAMIRADRDLRNEFSPEQIEDIAQSIESYSSEEVFAALSEHSGIPVYQLAGKSDVKEVRYYSNSTVDEYVAWERSRGNASESEEELVANAKNSGGFQTWDGIVYLNLSNIAAAARDGRAGEAVLDVLFHENLHSFPAYRYSHGDRLYKFYEGQTELFANILMSELKEGRDVYQGYSDGQTAAASVVYESLDSEGQKMLWRAFLEGDADALASAYDAKFGDGEFSAMLQTNELTTSLMPGQNVRVENVDYEKIAVLECALRNAGDDWAEVAQRANAHLGGGIIIPIRGEAMGGVVLTSSHLSDQVANGILRLESDKGVHVAIITGAHGAGDQFSVAPNTNMGYLRVDLDGYSGSKTPLQKQTFEQRGAPVVKALKANREAILAFKEM